MTAENENLPKEDDTLQEEWMIRPCHIYKEEYKDCRSLRARFHQYFIHGEFVDCTQWKYDVYNCEKWEDNKDVKAGTELIKSEIERRRNRLRAHYKNDVWTRRKSPPEDWNKPLPENLQKDYHNTYLDIKSREMKGEIVTILHDDSSFCCIL